MEDNYTSWEYFKEDTPININRLLNKSINSSLMLTENNSISNSSNVAISNGFLSNLTIALIVLKLCGVISVSWWIACLPLILSVVLTIIICILAVFLKYKFTK